MPEGLTFESRGDGNCTSMKPANSSGVRPILSRLSTAFALLLFPHLSAWAAEPVKIFFENPAPPGNYSEEKPDFLYFKDITITRKEKLELHFDVTLCGKIAAQTDNKVTFYFGFDIDADQTTGTSSLTFPDFGQDIGIFFVKKRGSSRFEDSAGTLVYQGKKLTFKIGQAKVRGDKIEFDVRSELFGNFPRFRVFAQSEQEFFERELKVKDQDVDQIPRGGAILVPSE